MKRISPKRVLKHRRGATVVEFAFVAPIFFLLLVASFEFARLNVIRHTADNAAYEAARIAMVPGATAAEAVNEANRIMSIAGARGSNVTVNPANIGPNTQQITVTVDIPLGQNGWITPRFTGSTNMRSQSTLKAERVQQ
ncbi:MAG: TadE/TadG family type IV pilus assembly protein [Bythopirellula sp.]